MVCDAFVGPDSWNPEISLNWSRALSMWRRMSRALDQFTEFPWTGPGPHPCGAAWIGPWTNYRNFLEMVQGSYPSRAAWMGPWTSSGNFLEWVHGLIHEALDG